ncbi:hypothetical protein K0C01_07305 [Salinarchaeum sp. IM2453]|uniref:hypothetical protein n=1 Tax=Salinarchaeum sp. IM2453 TaxID=2862870 RepID=UPI001C833828|nr:hypothetical protein [Salinarchaeum sp. IM2453]QZA87617.1 hypothetical protein K0C01_07305 [Salinarchaeum sp. IM2453]
MRVVGAVIAILVVAIIALVGIQIIGAIPPVDGPLSDTAEQLRVNTASALVLAVGGVGIAALIIGVLRGMG